MTDAWTSSSDRLRETQSGSGRCAFGVAAGLFLVGMLAGSSVRAQDAWMPTVATSPGGALHSDVPGDLVPGHVGLTPPKIDPRLFPSARSPAPVRRALKSGNSSPLVTGALPDTGDATAGGAHVPPVEKREALSPIRPLKPMVAAAGTAKAAAAKQGAEATAPAGAAEAGPDGAAADPLFKQPGPLDALPPNATAAQQYCFTTGETAGDARLVWHAKQIKEMEAELDKRVQQLEAKTQEYKEWLARRDDFSRKAQEKLVGFYARMRPDAAAVQLAAVQEDMAAAVIMKLETKTASAIMNEMDPERAAKIAAIISGAARVPKEKHRPAPPPTPDGEPEKPAAAASPPQPEEPKT